MSKIPRFTLILATFALGLALVVVSLGAYTRLTDAGLGCPDWPGCYGHLMVPAKAQTIQQTFPGAQLEARKAWTEMVHRYAAGTLGLCILTLFGLAWTRRAPKLTRRWPTLLVGLLIGQAALGMWTVTLKLHPLVVMGHLLGGMTICAVLWRIRLGFFKTPSEFSSGILKQFQPWAIVGLVLVFIQILLGGWVSSNYAGLACVGFPECNGLWLPHLDFKAAYNFFAPLGPNYQWGQFNTGARITIQYVHRVWAIVTAVYLFGLSGAVLRKARKPAAQTIAIFMMGIVMIQFMLGVINVTHLLPLAIAVAHNAGAVLLLLTLVTFVYYTKAPQHEVH